MSMQLEKVIPLGRSLDEYRHLFALSENDLDKKILSVADGPASVNAELYALGKKYVSVDPLYQFRADEIEKQFYQVEAGVFEQVEKSPQSWVWSYHRNLRELRNARIKVIRQFVADFPDGLQEKRYQLGELPQLDFEDDSFELALCSHFLFLYSDLLSCQFHLDAIFELLRVAEEVRIFPLLTLKIEKSPYLQTVLDELNAEGYAASVEKVPYEFQKGGNEMLRIGKLAE